MYGGSAAGCDFWHHLRSCMVFLVFNCKGGDSDVWMSLDTQKYGTLVHVYVLLYTNDCLVVSENSESILEEEIGRYFELKPDSIVPPSLSLGGYLQEVTFNTGIKAWYFGYTHYVQASVKNLE